MDYMGSAEFEFGALPASLRDMQQHQDELELRKTNITNIDGNSLYALTSLSEADFETWCQQFLEASNDKRQLKESLYIRDWFIEIKAPEALKGKKKQEYVKRKLSYRSNFWWDIVNGVMASFNKEFMTQCIRQNLEASWSYMDANAKIP